MLAVKRYEKIIERVNELGSVRVAELSKLFAVTEETIRRDLDQLHKQGKLRRSHGGAVKIQEAQKETPYFEREVVHVAEKKMIAHEAIKHIHAGERILLDASSTAWYMAAILPNITLTVLTNSIKVALELSNKEKITVISTGGALSPRSLSYIGPLAERSLELYHVDKAFISCKGIHLERGISESNEFQGKVKQKMIEVADRVYLMSDFSKFAQNSFAYVASCDEIDVIITDNKADEDYLQALASTEVEIIRASD